MEHETGMELTWNRYGTDMKQRYGTNKVFTELIEFGSQRRRIQLQNLWEWPAQKWGKVRLGNAFVRKKRKSSVSVKERESRLRKGWNWYLGRGGEKRGRWFCFVSQRAAFSGFQRRRLRRHRRNAKPPKDPQLIYFRRYAGESLCNENYSDKEGTRGKRSSQLIWTNKIEPIRS